MYSVDESHSKYRNTAIPDGKGLKFIGSVGTGFTNKMIDQLLRLMKDVRKGPLAYPPQVNKETRFRKASTDIVTWVKPELKCNIQYQEITME